MGPCSRKFKKKKNLIEFNLFGTTHVTPVVFLCSFHLLHTSHVSPILHIIAATACM